MNDGIIAYPDCKGVLHRTIGGRDKANHLADIMASKSRVDYVTTAAGLYTWIVANSDLVFSILKSNGKVGPNERD